MNAVDTHAPLAHYLALGDSYTIGEGAAESERWPVQLVAALNESGLRFAAPQIIACTGWTTDELSQAIDVEVAHGKLRAPYCLVSLLIGINDQYRGRSLAQFKVNFSALLARAIGFAGGIPKQVVVVSIPDWGVTPFAISSGRDRADVAGQIDAFNHAARTAARTSGATWVDVTMITRKPANAGLLVDDGLHPSGDMYRLWARDIQAALPAR